MREQLRCSLKPKIPILSIPNTVAFMQKYYSISKLSLNPIIGDT